MPLFSFVTKTSDGVQREAESEQLDLEAAKVEAIEYLGEILRFSGTTFWQAPALTLTVSDDAGQALFRLDLSALVIASLSGSRGDSPAEDP